LSPLINLCQDSIFDTINSNKQNLNSEIDNIEDKQSNIIVLIYPNPTRNEIEVDVKRQISDFTLIIVDNNTKNIVYTKNSADSGKLNIDVSYFKSGSYTLSIIPKDGKEIISKTFKKL